MSEKSEPWWKAVLTAFLAFLSSILSANKSASKATKMQVESNEIENRVNAASDDERARLRAKWTRPGPGKS